MQHARHLVDGVHVPHADHAPLGHVGEQADLLALLVRHLAVGAAQQGIGLDADLAQLLHRVLGRLGLELAGRGNVGQVGEVDKGRHVGTQAQAELAHGFEEGQGLDIAHGAADLDDGHIHGIRRADAGAALDVFLDLVGDVRNHLHRLAEVVAAALLLEHALVDAAGGEVVALLHARFDETLIVAQVEIGLGAVVGDEHLAVLERAHGARVDVDIGVELDEGDFEAARFEDGSQGRRGDAFAERRHDTAGDEDEFGGHGQKRACEPAWWEIPIIKGKPRIQGKACGLPSWTDARAVKARCRMVPCCPGGLPVDGESYGSRSQKQQSRLQEPALLRKGNYMLP